MGILSVTELLLRLYRDGNESLFGYVDACGKDHAIFIPELQGRTERACSITSAGGPNIVWTGARAMGRPGCYGRRLEVEGDILGMPADGNGHHHFDQHHCFNDTSSVATTHVIVTKNLNGGVTTRTSALARYLYKSIATTTWDGIKAVYPPSTVDGQRSTTISLSSCKSASKIYLHFLVPLGLGRPGAGHEEVLPELRESLEAVGACCHPRLAWHVSVRIKPLLAGVSEYDTSGRRHRKPPLFGLDGELEVLL